MGKIFQTDKVIRMGIWGLGRGRAFIDQCKALNIEIVAGCDIHKGMCEDFRKICPDAVITRDEDEFLAQDMDAVLVATYFFAHARDAIKALKSGKHVLSEISAFFTPAEGVRLVEAVEESGKLYMLAENYTDQFVKKLWDDGVFGELTYAEVDYVHEVRALSYSYLYGDPMIPGNVAHSWRSWLNFHYYCTHSLGAAMETTSTRPVKVCAPPSSKNLPGYLPYSEMGSMKPSFVTMDNGGIVRNLMGASTADSHSRKFWGSRAFVDLSGKDPVVSLGQFGRGPKVKLTPPETELTRLAAKAGHNGGDFYVLYNFANAVFNNVKPYWDIYKACDVTLTGIMAVKSEYNNGITLDVPDFREKAAREQYRNDHFSQIPPDPSKIFPEDQDPDLTGKFSVIMNDLDRAWTTKGVPLLIAALDGINLYPYIQDEASRQAVQMRVRLLLRDLPGMIDSFRQAKILAEKYPSSPGGKALKSYLDSGYPERMADPEALKKELQNFLLRADLPVQKQLRMSVAEAVIARAEQMEIPEGFSLRTFREGDEEAYVELMHQSGFDFWGEIQLNLVKNNALENGVFFLVEDSTGRLAATAMANKAKEGQDPSCGELGWVGAHPDFRGKRLSAIACSAVLARYRKEGYKKVILYTDDFRLPAIKTYLNAGFTPMYETGDKDTRKRWDLVYKKFGMILPQDEEILKNENGIFTIY